MTAVTADAAAGTVVNGPKDAEDWHSTDWDQAERDVGRLRQRIFAASQGAIDSRR
jgi:RNA-directed DNA polymerase